MLNYVALIAMAVAFCLGIFASSRTAQQTVAGNRSSWASFEKSDRLPTSVIHWLIAQTRDDVGAMHNMLAITNGLLAAIAAGIAVNLLR